MKYSKKAERASEGFRLMDKFREKLKRELPALRRVEIDLVFEDGKASKRIKLEVK